METFKSLSNLTGRTAMITGAAGGLGKVFARTLAELGANLILVDVNTQGLDSLAKEINANLNVKIKILNCDLENESEREKLISSVAHAIEELNILVNNAALVGSSKLTGWSVPFEDQTLDTWRRAIEVNLTSIFHLIKGLTPILKKSKGASVVNIASIHGVYAPNWDLYKETELSSPAAYSISKGGLIQLTRWLSTTLAPDVRVNSISPGGINRDQDSIFIKRYEEKVPLKRMGKEEDLIGAISFLTSDLSRYVTGINLLVDGGWGI